MDLKFPLGKIQKFPDKASLDPKCGESKDVIHSKVDLLSRHHFFG